MKFIGQFLYIRINPSYINCKPANLVEANPTFNPHPPSPASAVLQSIESPQCIGHCDASLVRLVHRDFQDGLCEIILYYMYVYV